MPTLIHPDQIQQAAPSRGRPGAPTRYRSGDVPAHYAKALASSLRERIEGEVRFDDGTRAIYSTDGSNYIAFASGLRVNGGWHAQGLLTPPGLSYYVRARGAGSSGFMESIAQFYRNAPTLSAAMKLGNGSFQFVFNAAGATNFTVLATTNVALPFANWTTLGSPTPIGGGTYQVTDPGTANFPRRYYRVRFP